MRESLKSPHGSPSTTTQSASFPTFARNAFRVIGAFLVGTLLVSCSPAPEISSGLKPTELDEFSLCMEAEGVDKLVGHSYAEDGFPLYVFESAVTEQPVAMPAMAEVCHSHLNAAADLTSFEFLDFFNYFNNYFLNPGGSLGALRSGSIDPGPLEASVASVTQEQVCGNFGCFSIATKLPGFMDGSIEEGFMSPAKVSWAREELESIAPSARPQNLSAIEQVGHRASPSAVVVFGDWCMHQATEQFFDEPVFHATNPGTGFFVSDSLILTSVAALATMDDQARDQNLDDALIRIPPSEDGVGACERYGTKFLTGLSDTYFESGRGPIVQLFDGRWALGEVVWKDDATGLGALQLKSVTADRRQPFDTWAAWQGAGSNQHWLSLTATDLSEVGETATIHHPQKAQGEGGWFVSPSDGQTCAASGQNNGVNGPRLYLDHYSDRASNGGPIVDASGAVIATVEMQTYDQGGTFCPANKVSTTQNTLGPLPRYYADSSGLTVGAPVTSQLISTLRELDPSVSSEPTPSSSGDTIRPAVSLESFSRYEVPLFGEDFTVSGFPLSEMNSRAIDIAKQATVAFIRETGCPTCDENRLNKNFDVPCLCTGFAVTENLIVTNDHCVASLSIGSKTTFRTFYGQDVEAELVGKTSLDGEAELNERYDEVYQGVPLGEGILTGVERGDVALLRTSYAMKLEPLTFADSSTLTPWEPLITVGHPATMTRTGPWVTGVGSFLGADYFTRTAQSYNLPAQKGASGSAVVNLAGELVGQIASGARPYQAEKTRVLPQKYGLFATELWTDVLDTTPAPYSTYSGIPVSAQVSDGAPSNYIREMINIWAPGELP